MTTAKELIEFLGKLDPGTVIVKSGHPDANDCYDDIYLDDIPSLTPLKEIDNWSWEGRYERTQTLKPGGFWAYCV